MTRPRAVSVTALLAILIAFAGGIVSAWSAPFGAPHPAAAGISASGVSGWIFAEQAAFYRSMSGFIRASKEDGAAMWGLFGISFLYGIFHAAGPGHGKAVISSYLIANEETWRRGVVLSFASAGIQSIVAIIVVAIAAVLLGATAKAIGLTVRLVEITSYALVILIGLRLLYVKGRGFLIASRELTWRTAPELAFASVPVAKGQTANTLGLSAGRPAAIAMRGGQCMVDGCTVHGFHCHDEHHASAWGHAHGPEPAELAGSGGWRRGLSAVVAVGLRPCSGAVIVLIFALAQDLFWTGIGATLIMGLGTAVTVAAIATLAVSARGLATRLALTRAGLGMLAMRGIEAGAAALIVAFGTLLLVGYMASERLWMFTG
ncbi:nickel/cobalt transporter [Bradyrhizobium sp. Leo121]|uniref:nickel/cobalt transporter n=1 Tax=Bradyrhizobium sp. Leo121 TaxID=1571195 RepID=UPI001028F480|nr:nickel/cobalt transporter [Bradyrhizobium sp. Leo121]RZN17442.1 nickel transporter [Bradyrhizobium sp. Leo121]